MHVILLPSDTPLINAHQGHESYEVYKHKNTQDMRKLAVNATGLDSHFARHWKFEFLAPTATVNTEQARAKPVMARIISLL